MTILAYRNGILASDSLANVRGTRISAVRKIGRDPDGAIFGATGGVADCHAFLRWCQAGRPDDAMPKLVEDHFSGLLIEKDGTVKEYAPNLNWATHDAPFFGWGPGGDIAIGAMAFGATAIEAVNIAIEYEGSCHGPVQIERLDIALPEAATSSCARCYGVLLGETGICPQHLETQALK